MSSVPPTVIAAAWYPDPADPLKVRWWDGYAWTEHTAERMPAIPPQARPQQPAPIRGQIPYVPLARDWGQAGASTLVLAVPRSAQTLPIWLLAVSPIWVGAAERLGTIFFFGTYPLQAGVVGLLIAWGLLFGLAYLDGSRLRSRGFPIPTSPAWILLFEPVFFIIRAVRVGRGGLAPLFVNLAFWLLLLWLAVALVQAQQGAVQQLTPPNNA